MAELSNTDSLDSSSTHSCSEESMSSTENLGAVGGMPSTKANSEDMAVPMEEAVDKLFEKHRSEIMFELRRLKMGDRPVTGQGNKEAVEDFFVRNQGDTETPPDQHRPEAVVVEVQGLVERRPVSSILQSLNFRRQLENSLRGALSQVSGSSSSSTAAAASPSRRVTLHQELLERVTDRNSQPPRPAQSNNAPSRASAVPSPPPPPVNNPAENDRLIAPAPSALPPPPPGPVRAQQWLQNNTQPEAPREQLHENFVWDNLGQNYREIFISDISELVQRQLVTDSLASEFRTGLERTMRNHLETTGTDGPRVAQYIQTLPRGQHIRNDFSDIGIVPGVVGPASLSDHLDDVSVISATAAVHVTQNQSTRVMQGEIRSLKSQIEELKSMMRVSFDLQLDIQRAIRQEVAAAMTSALTHTPGGVQEATGGTTGSSAAKSMPVDDTHCLICLDKATDSVLYQCGHMCVCYTCGMNLKSRGSNCPVCRAPIKDIIRAYRTNSE